MVLVHKHICTFALCALFIGCNLVLPASAGCFEDVGCTHAEYFNHSQLSDVSCQNLDFLRNSVYAENGYCFKKPQYRQIFDDRNCRFHHSSEVPLNAFERANVLTIADVERAKGCR